MTFVRLTLDLFWRRIYSLRMVRLQLVSQVWRLGRQAAAGQQLAEELAAAVPGAPALAAWRAAGEGFCPEDQCLEPICVRTLPADPEVRSLALVSLAEPMALALAETVEWLDREIAFRQRKGNQLWDLVERAHRARAAFEAYRAAVKPAAEEIE